MSRTTLLLLLAFFVALGCGPVVSSAKETVATTQPTINYRGEDLPIFAPPRSIKPKRWYAPTYPDRERKDGVDGEALILALVDADGKVAETEVVACHPSAAFGEAGKAAVLKWTFPQVFRDKKPIRYLVQVPLSFAVSER